MKICVVSVIFTEESDGGMKWILVLALSLDSVSVIYKQQDYFFLVLVYKCIKDRITGRLDNTMGVKDHHHNGTQ